jgi:hypothetical protein
MHAYVISDQKWMTLHWGKTDQPLVKLTIYLWAESIGCVLLVVRGKPARNNVMGIHFDELNCQSVCQLGAPFASQTQRGKITVDNTG